MAKKIVKKRKKSAGFAFKFNYTIMLSIMLVVISIVIIVIGVMFAYSKDSIKGIQDNLATKFITSLNVLNKPNETSEMFISNVQFLQNEINNVISQDLKIKDILVTVDVNDKNKIVQKIIYTSLDDKDRYTYKIMDNPSTFKLLASTRYNADNYRNIYIKKSFVEKGVNGDELKTYHINLIIPKDENIYLNNLDDFAKIFFSIILALSVIAAYLLARSISKPLTVMEETVSNIAKGDLSGRLDYTRYYEMNKLVQSYNMMANALQRMYSTLEVQVQDRTRELKNAYAELQNTQAMMVHSEKMKSLGELVAGIMHEINNPINFIYGNMVHLGNYSKDLISIIDEYTKYNDSLKPEEKETVENLKQEIDYEFLKSDMPDLIKSCHEGADRAKNIIQDLKSFSRMEETTIKDIDLPHEIDMTLNILHNKLKNKAEIHKEYMDKVPMIEAFGGQLNQVFMNILDNAAGAISEKGDIWIRINEDEAKKNLIIEIEDNGSGMDEETQRKVFDPFFTTKPVGQGTGLGMSITHKIIKNHQGDIRVESKVGVGTKFIITLPLNIDREAMNASMANEEVINGQV